MGITRRPPLELLDLATGYQRAKTLFALIELEIPTMLAAGPLLCEEIARRTKLHPMAADRLLNASVALGLLARQGDLFANAPASARYLVKGTENYLGDYLLKHDRDSYPRWMTLVERLRRWTPGETVATTSADDAPTAHHNLTLIVGAALAESYDFSAHALLLDIGGGTGAMSISICRAHPRLRAVVVDLPHVTKHAQRFIAEAGLADRIETYSADFKSDPLPTGFDVALLANLLSVASEEGNRRLFDALYERLPDHGAVIISGWILDDARTHPLLPVLFCLEDICWDAPDVERTASTYRRWLQAAGFQQIKCVEYFPPTSMLVGYRLPRA